MTPDILIFTYTYDRYEVLKQSLESMFRDPGMEFRLWVLDNGSAFFGPSGEKQLSLLLDYYKAGKIEQLLLNNKNVGIHHAINQIMALAKIHADKPYLPSPEFIMLTNDDMIYEDGWLSECYQTLLDTENYKKKAAIISPFHCKYPNGSIAHGMETTDTFNYNERSYEIKKSVSGNTWFMRGDFFLNVLDWYRVDNPTEGGDWDKLNKVWTLNMSCAITPREMAHHHVDATGRGKFNRLGHW